MTNFSPSPDRSVAHFGPDDEYNARGAAPSRAELQSMTDNMAEMERKYQESFQQLAREFEARVRNGRF